jgi:class 3 adenylate cyclase
MGIRIGLHSGPAFPVVDPIIKQFNYTGVHVSRAARIEPITPPGAVYASQAFAALAEAVGVREFACDYVGKTVLAKNYGEFPTYRVRRT